MAPPRTYLALGDGLQLDPVGAEGLGAARQVHQCLSAYGWQLEDRCAAWCRLSQVPTDGTGQVVTLAVGSADLLEREVTWAAHGLDDFAREFKDLLTAIREGNPAALLIVANVPNPRAPLDERTQALLDGANTIIAELAHNADGVLVDISGALRSREAILLTDDDVPTLAGASVVATLFLLAMRRAGLLGP